VSLKLIINDKCIKDHKSNKIKINLEYVNGYKSHLT